MARTQTSNGKAKTPSPEELAAQIGELKGDISALTKMLAEYAADTEAKVEEKAKDAAGAAKDYAALAAEEAKIRAEHFGAQANDFVAEKPGIALGIAAGLGFLIGAWGSRR